MTLVLDEVSLKMTGKEFRALQALAAAFLEIERNHSVTFVMPLAFSDLETKKNAREFAEAVLSKK